VGVKSCSQVRELVLEITYRRRSSSSTRDRKRGELRRSPTMLLPNLSRLSSSKHGYDSAVLKSRYHFFDHTLQLPILPAAKPSDILVLSVDLQLE
jgi:hypothetical protein